VAYRPTWGRRGVPLRAPHIYTVVSPRRLSRQANLLLFLANAAVIAQQLGGVGSSAERITVSEGVGCAWGARRPATWRYLRTDAQRLHTCV
jgi:hypothetical protein